MISVERIAWGGAGCDRNFGKARQPILRASAKPTSRDGIRSRLGRPAHFKCSPGIFLNMKNLNHLLLLNFPVSQSEAMFVSLENWAYAVGEFMRTGPKIPSEEFLEHLAESAWNRSGLRCHALETLERHLTKSEWPKAIGLLRRCAVRASEPDQLVKLLAELKALSPHLLGLLFWIDTESVTVPLRHQCVKWRAWKGPAIFIDADGVERALQPTTPRKSAKALYQEGTRFQQQAIRHFVDLVRVKQMAWEIGGILPRTNALVVGLSGSGKSWACRAVAHICERPIFTATIGSWAIQAGRAEVGTVERIRRHLRAEGPSVLFFDEIDKLRLTDSDNLNYLRSIWDELMSILDGTVSGWSQGEIDSLRKSHFFLAGAFQDLYRAHPVSGDDAPQISFEEIVSCGWLPQELTNRIGALVEIRLPLLDEIVVRMEGMEEEAGIEVPEAERLRSAQVIAASASGLRGLENYALDLAIRFLRSEECKSKRHRR